MRKTWITLKWTAACWYARVEDDDDVPDNVLIPIRQSAGMSFPQVKAALLKIYPDAFVSGSLRLQAEWLPIHPTPIGKSS